MIEILKRNRKVSKAGLGLRIDNLPDTEIANLARKNEERMWTTPVGEGLYKASIDTTFCVYRPGGRIGNQVGIRTGYPYIAEHLTWYEDFDNLSDELEFYSRVARCRWTGYSKKQYYTPECKFFLDNKYSH